MKQAERITRTSIKEVSRRVYVRSSIIEYRAGQIETEREGFPRVYTCSHHGTPAPGQCRWDGATPRCRECRPPIRILGKKGKRERNVHCRDDKSGINRATSRLSININSETRIPRGQIRELDSHSIPMRRWASRKSSNIRSNLLQRTIYDVDRSCTRPLTTSTIFLLAATSSFLSTRRYARLLSRRPSSNAQRDRLSACSAFFLFFPPFFPFPKEFSTRRENGIIETTCVSEKSEFPLLPFHLRNYESYLNMVEAYRKRNSIYSIPSAFLPLSPPPHHLSCCASSIRG